MLEFNSHLGNQVHGGLDTRSGPDRGSHLYLRTSASLSVKMGGWTVVLNPSFILELHGNLEKGSIARAYPRASA